MTTQLRWCFSQYFMTLHTECIMRIPNSLRRPRLECATLNRWKINIQRKSSDWTFWRGEKWTHPHESTRFCLRHALQEKQMEVLGTPPPAKQEQRGGVSPPHRRVSFQTYFRMRQVQALLNELELVSHCFWQRCCERRIWCALRATIVIGRCICSQCESLEESTWCEN